MLGKVITVFLIILVVVLSLAVAAKTPAGQEFMAAAFDRALPDSEAENGEGIEPGEEAESDLAGESDAAAQDDAQPAPAPADSAPAPAPGTPEVPVSDSDGSDRAEPVPAPRPSDPLPPVPPSPDDAEEGTTSDPPVTTVPGGGGSPSIATGRPGTDLVISPIPSIIGLRPIRAECGFITMDHSVYVNTYIYAGDDPYNRFQRGFISFDISALAGATVQRVTLRMANPVIRGNPSIFHLGSRGLEVFAIDWHSDRLQKADYHRTGGRVGTFTNYDITFVSVARATNPVLAEELQRRIDNRSDRFRLRLQFVHELTNDDKAEDGVRYASPQNDILLTVEFTR